MLVGLCDGGGGRREQEQREAGRQAERPHPITSPAASERFHCSLLSAPAGLNIRLAFR